MIMLKASLLIKFILAVLVLMGVFAVACNGSDEATQAPAPTTEPVAATTAPAAATTAPAAATVAPAATPTPTAATGGARPTATTALVIATATPPPVPQATPTPEPVVTSTSGRLVTALGGPACRDQCSVAFRNARDGVNAPSMRTSSALIATAVD